MIAFNLTIVAIAALVLLRNEIVHRHLLRRIAQIHARNNALIEVGDFDGAPSRLKDYDGIGNYFVLMLDLRKWTYRQFYGSAAKPDA